MKLALLAALALVPWTGAPAVGDECAATVTGYTCTFEVDTRASLPTPCSEIQPMCGALASFEIPVYERAIANVTVLAEGGTAGWVYVIERHGPQGPFEISRGEDATSAEATLGVASRTMAHVMETDATVPHSIVFSVGESRATYRIIYEVAPITQGVAPIRPAATRDDPHMRDIQNDARRGGSDVLAAWFDDAHMGDGLFEAHLAVQDLTDVMDDDRGDANYWDLHFNVTGIHYRMRWSDIERCAGVTVIDNGICLADEPRVRLCRLWRIDGNADAPGQSVGTTLLRPICSFDNETSTLSAAIPESSVGSPDAGVPFEDIHVSVWTRKRLDAADVIEDTADHPTYPFALGGPAVWDELNPRLAVPPDPWFYEPLAAENVPNTLSVLGPLFAGAAFIAGVVLYARRRRILRRWLDRIDGVVAKHEGDARSGLLALGDLQSQLLAILKDGGVTESQFQVLAQRIAFAASQLSLRRDLGMDDGVPGEEPRISKSVRR